MTKKINLDEVIQFVESNIDTFHSKRAENLSKLKLEKILKRKNPYLFKAKNILTASDLITSLLDAHLSSSEEAIFGDFLEKLAIFVNQEVYAGTKSSAEGIDLEFNRDSIRYIVSIKSGPHWGNSGQIKKMKENFTKAKKILRTSNSNIQIRAVNGCCSGKNKKTDQGEYFKYCGQEFWELISGDADLYINIIKPIGHKAKEKTDEFYETYAQIINKFTREFSDSFCKDDRIDWKSLVKFNAEKHSKA